MRIHSYISVYIGWPLPWSLLAPPPYPHIIQIHLYIHIYTFIHVYMLAGSYLSPSSRRLFESRIINIHLYKHTYIHLYIYVYIGPVPWSLLAPPPWSLPSGRSQSSAARAHSSSAPSCSRCARAPYTMQRTANIESFSLFLSLSLSLSLFLSRSVLLQMCASVLQCQQRADVRLLHCVYSEGARCLWWLSFPPRRAAIRASTSYGLV